jgi:hypothetical protein
MGWLKGLETEYPNLIQEKSEKNERNFKERHRTIMIFKAWPKCVHYSANPFQPYFDEYSYAYNWFKMNKIIYENLIKRIIDLEPYSYEMIIA